MYMKKFFILLSTLISITPFIAFSQGIGTIPQLQQFVSTTSPVSGITQQVYGKSLIITGLTPGSNLCLDANSRVTTTGCTSGGGGSGGGTWSTTTSTHSGRLVNYSNNTTDIVTIGSSSTTTAEYYFDPNTLFAYLSGRTSLQYASTTALTASGNIYTPTLTANSSAGVLVEANNGTDVGIFGAGNTANTTFYGGVNIDGATRLATSLTGLLKASSGTVSAATAGTDYENPLTFSWPLIRSTNAISWGGLSTTTALTTGHIPFVSGVNTFSSRATTSVTCSGTVSCTGFDVLGSSPITITGSGGGTSAYEIATTSTIAVPQLAYFTNASGRTTLGGVATSSLSVNGSISSSGTLGSQVGGTASQLSLNMANANTWTALQTFTNSSTTLGSFSYASSTVWRGGGLTSCSNGTTEKLLYNSTTGQFSCGTDQGGGISGSGTTGAIPKFTAATTLGDSLLSDNGSTLFYGGNFSVTSGGATEILSTLFVDSTSEFNSTMRMGTSTGSNANFYIYSPIRPHIALSDGAGISQWTMRNAGGNFYLATTTIAGTATSSVSALTINTNGRLISRMLAVLDKFITVISATFTPSEEGEIGIDTTSNQLKYYAGGAVRVVSPTLYSSFTYSTSTSFTGTTTIPLGTAYVAETWTGVQCFTDAGTVNVSIYDGTNRMNMFNASTTVGTVTLSTNNTFTAAEKRYVDIGTPASSPTKVSCTVAKTLNQD